MVNFTLFLNSFLSYLLLMVIIVAVGAAGLILGKTLRKKKDAKAISQAGSEDDKMSQ